MEIINVFKSYEGDTDRSKKISQYVNEILQKLGLTQNESRVYIYLSKNGFAKARDIASNQNIPRTQTYHLLTALHNKGIVSVISGTPTKFKGVEFEKALDILINNELKRIEELQLMRDSLNDLWQASF